MPLTAVVMASLELVPWLLLLTQVNQVVMVKLLQLQLLLPQLQPEFLVVPLLLQLLPLVAHAAAVASEKPVKPYW